MPAFATTTFSRPKWLVANSTAARASSGMLALVVHRLRAATGCGSIVVEDHCRATAREFPRVGRTQAAGAAASRSPHGPRMMVAVNVGFAFLLT